MLNKVLISCVDNLSLYPQSLTITIIVINYQTPLLSRPLLITTLYTSSFEGKYRYTFYHIQYLLTSIFGANLYYTYWFQLLLYVLINIHFEFKNNRELDLHRLASYYLSSRKRPCNIMHVVIRNMGGVTIVFYNL